MTGKKEVQTRFWQPRITAQISSILDASDPDLLCLQEVWMSPTVIKIIGNEAKERGYRAVFCRRTGMKLDGVAVLARSSKFEVLNYWEQEICPSGNRVCLWLLLKCLTASPNGQMLVAGCTHFTFPHDEEDPQRLEQSKKARFGCYSFAEKYGVDAQFAPLILAGDLNCSASADNDEVVDVFREDGWRSAFMEAHGKEAVATHRTHRKNHAGADLVLMRGPVKTIQATLLPDDEPDTAFMPRPELGGTFGLSAPRTLQEWCQFSDHRPLVTKLLLGSGSTQP
jgi:endonuclease/exonuclease/phosphatase family metal-dependent hydrolase